MDDPKGRVQALEQAVVRAISEVRTTWAHRDSVDVSEYLVDVLAFRNFDVFESVRLLLCQGHVTSAELLLRPLFEGTVCLEWCAHDPVKRGIRFRCTCFASTLELASCGPHSSNPDRLKRLRDAVAWCQSAGIKRLPTMKQMVAEIAGWRPGAAYELYQLLSKRTHGTWESWEDHLTTGGHTTAHGLRPALSGRALSWRAMAAFLGLRNVILLGVVDPVLKATNAGELDGSWVLAYKALEREKDFEVKS